MHLSWRGDLASDREGQGDARGHTVAVVDGTLNAPIGAAMDAMRRAAASAGYALAEGYSGPNRLVFMKGASGFIGESQIVVEFVGVTPASTRLKATSAVRNAGFNWGHGKRMTRRLFDAIGASY
jgi:hypothetical protein